MTPAHYRQTSESDDGTLEPVHSRYGSLITTFNLPKPHVCLKLCNFITQAPDRLSHLELRGDEVHAVLLQHVEERPVLDARHLENLRRPVAQVALVQRGEEGTVVEDTQRRAVCPQLVLLVVEVDGRLDADGRVDNGHQSGRDLQGSCRSQLANTNTYDLDLILGREVIAWMSENTTAQDACDKDRLLSLTTMCVQKVLVVQRPITIKYCNVNTKLRRANSLIMPHFTHNPKMSICNHLCLQPQEGVSP
jgi:hypothetical protein